MASIHLEFVVDEKNEKKAVMLPFSEWQKIVEELEELEDIRAFDEAKAQPSKPIPFEDAAGKIERGELP